MLMSQIEKASATLTFDENKLEIIDFEHYVSDEEAGNPYNCYFRIKALSDGFSALSAGCEYDYKALKLFIKELDELIDFKREAVHFEEYGYGSKLTFSGDGMGHIKVSGVIYGEHRSQSLLFEFMTDQTVYPSFIKELRNL